MESKFDSTSLFIDQVRQHADALTGVLSSGGRDEQGFNGLMERCMCSSRLLAGSMLIMELDTWHQCLNGLYELFSRYRNLRLHWDERIAQVVSELIEKEELLLSAHTAGEIAGLASIVPDEEIEAIIQEINILLEAEPTAGPGADEKPSDAEAEMQPDADECLSREAADPSLQKKHFPVDLPVNLQRSTDRSGVTSPVVDARSPLAITQMALERAVDSLNRELSAAGWVGSAAGNEPDEVVRHLCLVDFYARSMKEIFEHLPEQRRKDPVVTSLEPVRNTLEDYANLLCIGNNRRVTVDFTGAENTIDANLLFEVGRVLQYMIRDVVVRCDDPDLCIQIKAIERNGALWWEWRDNGNNCIRDSKFDRDEFLAFYPSLKQIRKTLEKFNSILWVEPDDDAQTRFVFTTRLNEDHNKFVVWGAGENSFGALSTQFCTLLSAEDAVIGTDSKGEHLVVDDHKVPLVRLQLVYSDAPEAGDKIAIIGSLEHKVAIYVDGEGHVESGVWHSDAVSKWKGLPRGVAELDGSRIPIIEANELLVRYLSASGETIEDGISGGVVGDGTDLLPESQATFLEEASSPPDCIEEKVGEVLVVEQSKAVKEAFEAAGCDAKFNMKIVERVEDALHYIRDKSPRLIISEFRMPTLAAQKIKNALQDEGRHVPIVVTTSHTGANAELLVKKLGVADYLSKPLRADMISAKLDQYLQAERISSS